MRPLRWIAGIVILIVVIGAFASRGGDDDEPSAATTTAQTAEEALPLVEGEPLEDEATVETDTAIPDPQARPLGPKEQAWMLSMADQVQILSDAAAKFSELSDPENALLLIAGDQNTIIEFAIPTAVFMSCSDNLKNLVGPPPTKRFQRVYQLLGKACDKYGLSGRRFAAGVDSLNAELIEQSATAMQAGTRYIKRANRALNRIQERIEG